jgi:F-type H+-transporting ATPase subunit b
MFADPAFWALVGLVLFFAVVVYMKVPGVVTSSLDKRADAISSQLEQARKLREEAEALLAEYRKKAREAESEAALIVDQAKREADALGAEARRRLEEYVAGRTRLAEEKIAQAEAQAIQEVRALSADVAVAAAGKILSRRVKGEAGNALIDKVIGEVKAKLN